MLKIVLNSFNVPHYDSDHGRYLLEDENGKRYWLDDQVYAENHAAMVKAYITEGYDESEAQIKADERAFSDWDIGMDGVEADEVSDEILPTVRKHSPLQPLPLLVSYKAIVLTQDEHCDDCGGLLKAGEVAYLQMFLDGTSGAVECDTCSG